MRVLAATQVCLVFEPSRELQESLGKESPGWGAANGGLRDGGLRKSEDI